MKKWLAILLALVMVLSMFMLTACGEKAEEEEEKQEEKDDKDDEDNEDNEGENEDSSTTVPGKTDVTTVPGPTSATTTVRTATATAIVEDIPMAKTTAEIINGAIRKTNKLDSMDMVINMDMGMKMMGQSIDMEIGYKAKAAGLQSGKPTTRMTMTMAMLGEVQEYDIYADEDNLYMVVDGQGVKMSADQLDSYDATGTAGQTSQELPADLLNAAAVKKGADGSCTVAITMSNDMFDDVFDDLINGTSGTVADGANVKSIAITDPAIEVTAGADGYLDSYKLKFKMAMTMEIEGTSVDADVDYVINIVYNNPGRPVTVTPMAGYQNFTAM